MDVDFDPARAQHDLPGTALQQSATYAAVLAAFGCTSALADISLQGRLLGRARIHLRRIGPLRMAWLPRGPVWTQAATPPLQADALSALRRAAPWRAVWAISGDTGIRPRGIPAGRGVQLAELDLAPGDADRRAAQHGKWRNRLTCAEKAGLCITARPLSLPRDARLLAKESAQQKARGYAALPASFTGTWCALAPADTLLVAAEENGVPLGFMLMLLHAPVATYHAGWSGPRGRALNVHNLLLWRASQDLSARGYTRLDLGLSDPARLPGLARFKLGAGARLRHVGPTVLGL